MMETLTSEFTPDFKLKRNPSGRLQFTASNNTIYDGIYPVRAFPVSAPEEGLSLLNQEGHELAWINRLSDLPVEVRTLIEEELEQREFMPEILRINHVSSFATPSNWEVETDRGEALLILKTEDHIRRLAHSCLLISDSHGVNFLIREIDQLDNHSRKLLDRFL
jgi:hypothetical protein